jgi:hypothetical protein
MTALALLLSSLQRRGARTPSESILFLFNPVSHICYSRNFVVPQVQQTLTHAMGIFAMRNAMQLGDEAGTILSTAPSTVLTPLNYTIANVRPFDVPVANALDYVGLIYLLVLTFIAAVRYFLHTSFLWPRLTKEPSWQVIRLAQHLRHSDSIFDSPTSSDYA